jgi:hypothetical protein
MSSLLNFSTSDTDPRELRFIAEEHSGSVQITRELIQSGTHYSDTYTIETATELQNYSKYLAKTHQTSLWTILLYHTIRNSQFNTEDIFYVGKIQPIDILLAIRHPKISIQSFNMLFEESQKPGTPVFQTNTKTHRVTELESVGISGLPDTNALPTTIQYILQILQKYPEITILIPWETQDNVTISNFDFPINLKNTAELNLPQHLLGLSTDVRDLSTIPSTPQIVYLTGFSVFKNLSKYIGQYINQTDSKTVVVLFDGMGTSNTFSQFKNIIRTANTDPQTGCILYSEFTDHLIQTDNITYKIKFSDNKPVKDITLPTITIPEITPLENSVNYLDIYKKAPASTAQAITASLNKTVQIPTLPYGYSTILSYTPESEYKQIDFKPIDFNN